MTDPTTPAGVAAPAPVTHAVAETPVGKTPKDPRAARFEMAGWALFLVGTGLAFAFGPPGERGDWVFLAAGAGMLLYVLVGLALDYRASLSLLFFGLCFAGGAALSIAGFSVSILAVALIAGGVVLAVKAFRAQAA